MKLINLRIPGNFVDSFIYMGWLALFSARRSIIWIKVEHLCDKIGERFPDSGKLAQVFFARNDWMATQHFHSLVSAREIAQAYDRTITSLSQDIISFDLENLDHMEVDLALRSHAI